MKTARLFLLLLSLAALTGCALFTPPQFVNATTEITRDANGKIISSRYYRGVTGFSTNGDKEDAGSWAQAEQIALNSPPNQAAASTPELANGYEGLIASLRRDLLVEIPVGGQTRTFFVKHGEGSEVTAALPAGSYTATAYSRSKKYASFRINVRPQNHNSYRGKDVNWFVVFD